MNSLMIHILNSFLSLLLMWIVKLLVLVPYLMGVIKVLRVKETKIVLAAGEKGWKLIEFNELYYSACEYLGSTAVVKQVVVTDRLYILQVYEAIKLENPTHYFLDPRTGSQAGVWSYFESIAISILLAFAGIIPIVHLTDYSVRRWRIKASFFTSWSGVVVTYLSFRRVWFLFPHSRVIGPSIMPFSCNSLDRISRITPYEKKENAAVFVGSLYEPRDRILNAIRHELSSYGFKLHIFGRNLGGERMSNEQYWTKLSKYKIIVTTTQQYVEKGMDWHWEPSLVYRYLESMIVGSVLVTTESYGVERFFTRDRHFVEFSDPRSAAQSIAKLLSRPSGKEISLESIRRAKALVEARAYWLTIDCALGSGSLT